MGFDSSLESFYFILWDREECARQLRMSASTLRNMGKEGPPSVILGGSVYYRPDSVLKWLDKREKG